MPGAGRVSLSPPEGGGRRRSLVLAGGGIRVAYQAGVLLALEQAGLAFTHADGTSGGTINLAMLFSGLTPMEMCDRWRSLKVRDFVSFVPFLKYLNAADMMAMGDADGIVEKVFPHLGIDVAKINAATGMDGTFNVCNFDRKTNEAFGHRDVDLDILVAGISLPVFMPPVVRKGRTYTDSVWIKDANCMEAVRRGAEEIWLVWCIGNTAEYKAGPFEQYVHMIEMSAAGGLSEEFDRIRDINRRIEAGDSPYGQRAPIVLHVIKPEYPLPLDPDLYLGRIDSATLIAMGYADTKAYLRRKSDGGVGFQPEVTQMKSSAPGISFRETMAGHFALGETDPEAGAAKGKAKGTELAMHASINIRDLDGFIANPAHAGEIIGSIDFPPLGNGMPATHGVFNLFSPADDPDTKYMVYELGFEHGGEAWYLAGRKIVRDDPGLDLLRDTTTLFTVLHRGSDKNGAIAGAGVLTLGVKQLAKLVSTMKATNSSSTGQSAKTVLKFGKFFLGELWDSYARLAGGDG
jgi:predicted acylesterase/phospholipase RssA